MDFEHHSESKVSDKTTWHNNTPYNSENVRIPVNRY